MDFLNHEADDDNGKGWLNTGVFIQGKWEVGVGSWELGVGSWEVDECSSEGKIAFDAQTELMRSCKIKVPMAAMRAAKL